MNKRFPREMQAAMQHPNTKKYWVGFGKPVHPSDCENCGGWGFFSLIIASKGPFKSPAIGMSTHWDNGVWWGIQTFPFVCPVCMGGQAAEFNPDEPIANPAILKAAEHLSAKREEQEEFWNK